MKFAEPDVTFLSRKVCRTLHRMFYIGAPYGDNPLERGYTRLLLQLSVMIIIIRILQFLLKPLKQPRYVAEIMAGIIVGPSVLGRYKKWTVLFPRRPDLELELITTLAVIYYIFVISVQMDVAMITKAGKKATVISLSSILFPFLTVYGLTLLLWGHLDENLIQTGGKAIAGLTSSISVTGFLVLHPILQQLKLLNSDVGRLSMSASMITDAVGWTTILLFESLTQQPRWTAFAYLFSTYGLILIVVFVVRPIAIWMNKQTPPGRPVKPLYVRFMLFLVLFVAGIGDLIGGTVANGPLMVGFALPDGPPLGSAIVERSQTVVNDWMMPLFYIFYGQLIDVHALTDWKTLLPLLVICVFGYFAKFIGTVLPALYYKTPLGEAVTLGLLMSLRGQVELFTYLHWLDMKMLNQQSLTLMVLCTIGISAIATPAISILAQEGGPTILDRRKTVQGMELQKELNVVACIHGEGNVPAIVKLIEASNPTKTSPVSVYVLHLVELIGRASPMLIAHNRKKTSCRYARSSSVVSAFKIYEQISTGQLSVQSFTSVSPYTTVHQDICRVAMENRASLIIYPYYVKITDVPDDDIATRRSLQMVLSGLQAQAPCSVAVLVERTRQYNNLSLQNLCNSKQHIAVLFFGGADSREALSIADRFAGKFSVTLKVLRFLSFDDTVDKGEKMHDNVVVTRFRENHIRNSNVAYKEVTVKNGVETVSNLRKMNNESYDLWIVGRQTEDDTAIYGLTDWIENTELGVIGDFLSSPHFGGTASVLVVQQ